MSEPLLDSAQRVPRGPVSPYARLSIVVCWLILATIAIGIPTLHALNDRSKAAAAGAVPASAPMSRPADGEVVDFQTELMGKYVVGAGKVSPKSAPELIMQMDGRATSPAQKIAVGIVTAELNDRAAGLKRIDASNSPDRFDFDALYNDQKPLPADVVERYGFFARLAESIDQPASDPRRAGVLAEAQRTVFGSGVAAAGLVVVTVAGFGLLVTGVVLAALGKMRLRVDRPRGPAHVYVEAFTIYLGGFVLGSFLIQWLLPQATLQVHGLMMTGMVILGVTWPLVRGVPWAVQRFDWGLIAGKHVLVEMLCGIGGYLAGLPVVAIGLLITVLLMRGADVAVTHPIVQQIADHKIFVFVLASVFAPLTEETLFRGALLSHLRGRLGPVVAAGITGLVFASVHPQGWPAIPALGSIGFVLAMIRQWRGTLIASMTAHAVNNTAVLLIVMMIS